MEFNKEDFLNFVSKEVEKAENQYYKMQDRYYYNSSGEDELGQYKIDTAYNYYLGMQHLKAEIKNYLNKILLLE